MVQEWGSRRQEKGDSRVSTFPSCSSEDPGRSPCQLWTLQPTCYTGGMHSKHMEYADIYLRSIATLASIAIRMTFTMTIGNVNKNGLKQFYYSVCARGKEIVFLTVILYDKHWVQKVKKNLTIFHLE